MSHAPCFGPTSLLILLAALAPARADPVADFYRGKTVNVLIGVGVGGEYDLQARLVARHIGKHIPGNPTVVAQNMTGAGGLKMTNYLASRRAARRHHIGMIQNAFPALQAAGLPGRAVRRHASSAGSARSHRWSRPWRCGTRPASPRSRTRASARSSPAPSARGAITYTYPALMNELLGTRFKIVTGYTGGNQINLAMERGEVEARNNTWSSWKATKRAWLDEKKITVIAQAGPRAADLAAPSVEDIGANPDEPPLIALVMSARGSDARSPSRRACRTSASRRCAPPSTPP